jgi:hypothetical protein
MEANSTLSLETELKDQLIAKYHLGIIRNEKDSLIQRAMRPISLAAIFWKKIHQHQGAK